MRDSILVAALLTVLGAGTAIGAKRPLVVAALTPVGFKAGTSRLEKELDFYRSPTWSQASRGRYRDGSPIPAPRNLRLIAPEPEADHVLLRLPR